MRIICSQCQTRFRVDDKYMTARGVRVQCPRCAHVELIKPAPAEAIPVAKNVKQGFSPPPAPREVSTSQPPPPAPREVSASQPPPPAPREVPASQPPPPAPREASASQPPLPAPREVSASQPPPDAELDFSDLRSELLEEEAVLQLQKPSLEGWELQPTQTIVGPSIHCQVCGKVLADLFEQALEVCESCRNLLPLKPLSPSPAPPPVVLLPSAPPPVVEMELREEVEVARESERASPVEGVFSVLEESALEEMESLTNQYTPPYAFESSIQYADQRAAAKAELSSKRHVWSWLRWVLMACGVVVLFALLFWVVSRVR